MLTHLVTALTLAATLVHSALGCCWHHDHGTDEPVARHSTCCSHHSTGAQAHKTSRCGHDPADQDDHQSPTPCDHSHGGCVEPNCVYVRADDGNVLNAIEWSMALMPTPVAEPSPVHVGVVELLRESTPPRPAAQQLRALLQVWVV